MHVVPVIDLRHGQVVHGVAGQREQYARICSELTPSTVPAEVAAALLEQTRDSDLYVADLDAIVDGRPQYGIWAALQRTTARLWIDAGVADVRQFDKLLRAAENVGFRNHPPVQWIVGLESVRGPTQAAALAERLGPERAIFSLDMKAGRLLARGGAHWPSDPVALADRVVAAGYQQIIVLDLAHVGSRQGVPIAETVAGLRVRHPHVRWTAGGGVRHYDDLVQLAQAGCFAALVATALHQRTVTRADIERLRTKS